MDEAFDQLDKSKRSVGGGGDYAPWWNDDNFGVDEGDQLIGIVVEKHAYTDPGGDDHPVATVRSIGGESDVEENTEVSTPTRKGIEDFAEDLELGELALIEYEGEVATNSGRDMHTYAASKLEQEDWQEMEDAEDILAIWEDSDHFRDNLVEGN